MDDAPTAHRRRPWTTRRFAAALPTAAAFDHMPTAFHHGTVENWNANHALQGDSRDQRGGQKEDSCLVARRICSKLEELRPAPQRIETSQRRQTPTGNIPS